MFFNIITINYMVIVIIFIMTSDIIIITIIIIVISISIICIIIIINITITNILSNALTNIIIFTITIIWKELVCDIKVRFPDVSLSKHLLFQINLFLHLIRLKLKTKLSRIPLNILLIYLQLALNFLSK